MKRDLASAIKEIEKDLNISSPNIRRTKGVNQRWYFRINSKGDSIFENFSSSFDLEPLSFLIFGGYAGWGLLGGVSQADMRAVVYKDSYRRLENPINDFLCNFLLNRGYEVERRDYAHREKLFLSKKRRI